MMALSGIMLSSSTDCVTAPIGSLLTGKLIFSHLIPVAVTHMTAIALTWSWPRPSWHPLSSPALTTRRINTANWRMDRTVTLH
jgi:hypothetical protein